MKQSFWQRLRTSWHWPKIRNPFRNPIQLHKLPAKLFSRKKTKKITWRMVGKAFLWGLAGFVLILVFLFAWFAKDLPTPGKIRALTSASSTRLFDRNMKPLYTISGEKKRIIVDDKDIPITVRQATVALEDKDFYKHPGIDPKAIIRSAVVDVIRGRKAEGASTITQQFVKNALLTNEKSIVRKIKEAILAVEIEFLYSKEQILTMYLNEIPYGGNNYGIEAAARSFFNKSAKDLTLDEAATLAALPQAPTTLSPYGQNVDRLMNRRDSAINSMRDLGFITAEQATTAKEVKPHFAAKHDSITAPHFVLFVKDWLVDYFTKELGDQQLAEQKVEEGGLTVVTTLDLDKQQIAEDVLSKARDGVLKKAGASNAGLVSIDPKQGEIISMVGSVDYFQDQFGSFNVVTANRQPGSSFKPIVYSTAFKDKYNPATTLFDLKTDFGNYIPENFTGQFIGPVTIRKALGNSLNIPAVKTLGLVGIDKALKTASDLGITTLTDKDRYGLSLVLGGGEVKLLELTGAYGVFANGGQLMPTTPVLKITDSKNKDIYNHADLKDGRVVLDPQIAYEITNILSDIEAKKPVFSGVLSALTLKGRPTAVKTGTTNAFRDAWTIGYTPQLVTGVWAGNNDNSSMNRSTGAIAAAPLWKEYMDRALNGQPVENFNRPDGIQEITVDRLSNKLPVDGSEPIKDIFASWQVPTEKDNVHVQLRVCKENGLLADASIPDELAENRTFVNIHSEKPDNPNWEGPVLAWAAANGLTNKPPAQKCTAGNNTAPTVQITSPTDGAEVSGTLTIAATASAPSGVRGVEFLIDGISIGTDSDAPYSASYNSSLLANGNHTVTATVTSVNGATASNQISIQVNRDTTPPGEITNLNYVKGLNLITFTWKNPTDADFKSVKLYITGTQQRTIEIAKPNQSTIVTGLTAGSYHFLFKTVDVTGNESDGISIDLSFP